MGRMVNSKYQVCLTIGIAAVGAVLLVSSCGNPLIEAIQQDVKEAHAPALPDIEVTHGGTVLPSGGLCDDFGTCFVGYSKSITFQIENVGKSDLVIPASDPVVLDWGTVFMLDLPAQNIPQDGVLKPGDKLSFGVTFEPHSTGVSQDTVTISSDDPDEGTYTFTVQGTGIEAGTIAVPNGGESYRPGDVCTIQWGPLAAGMDLSATVKIEYSAGGGDYTTIIGATADDGEHQWTIPDNDSVQRRADYKIKITSIQYPSIFTESQGDFAIGTINLTSPNGGEQWQRGTTKSITWTSELGATVNIELLKGGSLSQTIATGVANNLSNSYPWPISGSQTLDDDYRIRVELASNTTIADTSAGDFAVFGGTVATPDISPNTGTYNYAQTVSISCSTPGATIRYTLDGSTPSRTHGATYSSSFLLRSNTTVRAMAYVDYWWDSSEAVPSTLTFKYSSQVDKVVASDSATSDEFGSAVSIDGDFLFAGAPRKSSFKGSAYFFRRTSGDDFGSSYSYVPADVSAPDYYGCAVDVVEEAYVIIGARAQNTAQGAAYIYSWNTTGFWNTTPTRIAASDAQNHDYFGQAVALSADRTYAIVGAPQENGGSGDPVSNAGAVYIFRRDQGNTWYQMRKLENPSPAANEFFGTSVAISDNYLIVGCSGDDSNRGAAHIYVDDGKGSWTQSGKLTAFDSEAGARFGRSAAIDGSFILVGADGQAYDYFGWAVDIQGSYAVVGAYCSDLSGQSNAGAAYIFK